MSSIKDELPTGEVQTRTETRLEMQAATRGWSVSAEAKEKIRANMEHFAKGADGQLAVKATQVLLQGEKLNQDDEKLRRGIDDEGGRDTTVIVLSPEAERRMIERMQAETL